MGWRIRTGATIILGLPIGRLRAPLPRLKTVLNAVAIGILVFLLWDVLTHAWQPIDEALAHHQIGDALGNGLMLAAAVGVGLLGLVWVDPFSSRHRGTPVGGPGTATVSDINAASWADAAGRLALMIAVGIGLHNFAEGLAIGNSAAAGDIGAGLRCRPLSSVMYASRGRVVQPGEVDVSRTGKASHARGMGEGI